MGNRILITEYESKLITENVTTQQNMVKYECGRKYPDAQSIQSILMVNDTLSNYYSFRKIHFDFKYYELNQEQYVTAERKENNKHIELSIFEVGM